MTISETIIALREQKGWSQYRLHKKAAIPQATLRRIEAGINQPSTDTLKKICAALEVSMAVFDSYDVAASHTLAIAEPFEKYTCLSDRDKETVDALIEFLYTRKK